MRRLVSIMISLFLVVGIVRAQDPAKVGPNIYKCTFENERMRVCEVRFKPGDTIGMHSHPAHLVYVTAPGKLRITPAGKDPVDVEFKAGQAVWSEPDVHSAVAIGNSELRGLVIELKDDGLDPVQRAIIQMERDWANAFVSGDMSVFDRVVAGDWSMTGSDGAVMKRADMMGDLKSGALKFTSMTPSDLNVRIIGDTAIVTGRSRDKVTYKGQDMSGDYSFTDVFVKRDGRWQAVSTHVTKVAPAM